MWSLRNIFTLYILVIGFFYDSLSFDSSEAFVPRYSFVVKDTLYERLCKKKKIMTVNGMFPGPTLEVHKGDTIIVDVFNRAKHNVTIHWHGVRQPRNPWSDGPVFITQCPIQPGGQFSQTVIFSEEEGTLWWHAHNEWTRATVHGAIIIYPKRGTSYPFPKPHAEVPIVLGEWWIPDVYQVYQQFLRSGGQPRDSDAYTINGQPGDFYPCSKRGTFKMEVEYGNTYLLRIVNADMNEILFFGVANHDLTLVGTDASYTKPLTRNYIVISPGQTMDCLLHANQEPNRDYYMAARAYVNGVGINFDNTTTTAILQYYKGQNYNYPPSSPPPLPYLPFYNDTSSAVNFTFSVRSLNSESHPISVPLKVGTRLVSTISINAFPCPSTRNSSTCQGPNGTRLAASMNNISFNNPSTDILEAYYFRKPGVFGRGFPSFPPLEFNYTADFLPLVLEIPRRGTKAKVLKYNSSVELVLQGTNLVAGIDHPMHLHGYSFYVVGWGFGNFDENKDPLNYNLFDPPLRNTVPVPRNGWTAIRFKASNPGVWFMHCHLERHLTWGMDTVFIVRNGRLPQERLLPRPPDMPPC